MQNLDCKKCLRKCHGLHELWLVDHVRHACLGCALAAAMWACGLASVQSRVCCGLGLRCSPTVSLVGANRYSLGAPNKVETIVWLCEPCFDNDLTTWFCNICWEKKEKNMFCWHILICTCVVEIICERFLYVLC